MIHKKFNFTLKTANKIEAIKKQLIPIYLYTNFVIFLNHSFSIIYIFFLCFSMQTIQHHVTLLTLYTSLKILKSKVFVSWMCILVTVYKDINSNCEDLRLKEWMNELDVYWIWLYIVCEKNKKKIEGICLKIIVRCRLFCILCLVSERIKLIVV